MSLGREHGKMIKNTYAAACGNERRQHEKVFQRNMRRTGDAFDPVHPIDGGGAHGGAGLRHHALCGTGGHGGASVVRPGRCCTCGRSSRRRCSRGTPSPTSRTVTCRWRGASSVPWTQSGASSMWREPRSTGTMYWGSPCGASMGWAMCPGYISRPPGLYLVLGAAVVLALLCIFPLRRRKGEKTEESPTGRCMATNAGEKAPTESVQAAEMEEEVPTLTEKPASAEVSEPVAEVQRPAETGRRQTSGQAGRGGGPSRAASAFSADGIKQKKDRRETLRKEVVSLWFCRQPEFGFIGKTIIWKDYGRTKNSK